MNPHTITKEETENGMNPPDFDYQASMTYEIVHMPTAHMSTDGCEALSAMSFHYSMNNKKNTGMIRKLERTIFQRIFLNKSKIGKT